VHTVIDPAERAVLEEKLRTVLGGGAATTALLKIIDAVNESLAPYALVVPIAELDEVAPNTFIRDFTVEDTPEDAPEDTPEVQVIESSP
jgi:hypothetical protein